MQAEWGKCNEAFMLNGGFCKTTCGHCNTAVPSVSCTDTPPNNQYTCTQQANAAYARPFCTVICTTVQANDCLVCRLDGANATRLSCPGIAKRVAIAVLQLRLALIILPTANIRVHSRCVQQWTYISCFNLCRIRAGDVCTACNCPFSSAEYAQL